MTNQRRELIRNASIWQQAQLEALAKKTFVELSTLPRRTKLESPFHLKGVRFIIERRNGENGGVEISVQRVWRSLLIFEGSIGPSFEMLPEGRIIYPDDTVDDED